MDIKKWKKNSASAFYSWLSDVKPRILHSDGRYRVFDPTPEQKEIIDNILASKDNNFWHSMSIVTAPRRHGKTVVQLCILLWLFTSRKNFNIVLHGATEQHCRRVQFSTLAKIIRNTPLLRQSRVLCLFRNFLIWSLLMGRLADLTSLASMATIKPKRSLPLDSTENGVIDFKSGNHERVNTNKAG